MVVRNTKEEKQWKYRLGGIKSSCINNHSKCKSIEFNRHRVVGWIRKQDPTICCLQETHLSSKNKQAQNEGMGDNAPSKWQIKESRCCHTYIRQSRLQDKKDYERQRGAVYNDKGDFPPRGHNTYEYIT